MAAKPVENTERVSTYISSEQLQALRELAGAMGMTVSGYIRALIIQATSKK